MFDLALQQVANGLLVGSTYALMALGLMVILGILQVINMSQGQLYMLGGYCSYFATSILGIGYFPSIAVAMLMMAVGGVVVERVAVRPFLKRPFYITFLSTTAVSLMIEDAAQILWTADPRRIATPFQPIPIQIGPVYLSMQRIFIFCFAVASVLAFAAFLKWTRVGLAIRALAKDRDTAMLMGINADRIHTLTFAVGAALAGAAGALIGAMFGVYPSMGELPLLKGFALVVMGGMGSVFGVLGASLTLGVAEGLTAAFISTSLVDLVAFATMIAVLLVRPEGLGRWGGRHG
jgi:branched-chain amino acid transport system permease protein